MSTIKTPVTVVATGVIEAIKRCEFRDADNKFLFVAYMSEQQANAIRDALNSHDELGKAVEGFLDKHDKTINPNIPFWITSEAEKQLEKNIGRIIGEHYQLEVDALRAAFKKAEPK